MVFDTKLLNLSADKEQKPMQKLDAKKLFFHLKHLKKDLQKLQTVIHHKQEFFKNKLSRKKKVNLITTLSIRITSNNIFCTLKKQKKIIYVGSAGIYKIHVSKKFLKSNTKLIISKFLFKIKKKIRFSNLLINITCPKKLKKKLLRQILKFRKKQIKHHLISLKKKKLPIAIAVKFLAKKCFNGCRPSKKRRKKRLKFRILK